VNVYLIGCRGSGKSEVGRRLSGALKCRWLDMDTELARRLGATIREYVHQHGWAAFRVEERKLLGDICARGGLVVSTGGGVVLDGENIAAMRRSGRLIWLKASPQTIWRRLSLDPASFDMRPALTAAQDGYAEICETLAQREPLYRRASDLAIDTDGMTAGEVARKAVWELGAGAGGPSSPGAGDLLDKTKQF
jgi:shikimate kinase